MDQDPLPRGSSQVTDRLAEVLHVVLELSQATVAVEAKNATYITEHVIVVDVLRVGRAADRTDPPWRARSSSNSCCPIRYRRRRWYSRVLPWSRCTVSRPRLLWHGLQ
jgi:hypothetical protein